jgi:LuxR family maltose regulon positive regulatory protein
LHAERLLSDARMRLLARWLGSVPKEDLARYPNLQMIHVWVINFTRGPRAALSLLEETGEAFVHDHKAHDLSLAVRPMLLSLCDRVDDARRLGLENLEKLPAASRFPRSMLNVTLATTCIAEGRIGDARRFVDAVRYTEAGARDSFAFGLTEALDGLMDLLRGDLRQAAARLRSALQPMSIDPGRPTKANAMAGILLAEVLYEMNDCRGAARLLEVHIPLIGGGGLPDQLIGSHVQLSRIHASRGDHEQAMQLLTDLEFTGHRLELRRVVLSARLERARQLLDQGKRDAAREELEASRDPLWREISGCSFVANDVETHEIGVQRWALRNGEAEQAVPTLTRLLAQAERENRFRRVVKLKVLLAEALYRTGQSKIALRQLNSALGMGAAEGYIRIFADEGPMVARLIREWSHAHAAGIADAVAALPQDYLTRLMEAVGGEDAQGSPSADADGRGAIEALTRKEVEVLTLTAEGHSNRVLAERLFVSEATVRTHLRNINAKLGVHSRVHAIAVARRHGILS